MVLIWFWSVQSCSTVSLCYVYCSWYPTLPKCWCYRVINLNVFHEESVLPLDGGQPCVKYVLLVVHCSVCVWDFSCTKTCSLYRCCFSSPQKHTGSKISYQSCICDWVWKHPTSCSCIVTFLSRNLWASLFDGINNQYICTLLIQLCCR